MRPYALTPDQVVDLDEVAAIVWFPYRTQMNEAGVMLTMRSGHTFGRWWPIDTHGRMPTLDERSLCDGQAKHFFNDIVVRWRSGVLQ